MEGKKILLTVHPGIHADLLAKAEQQKMSLQELIITTLRTTILAPPKKSNAGRPKKSDDPYLDMFSRKR